MKVGSLFAGVGGFDLGFEQAGFTTAFQVEIDEKASNILARHWPGVTRFTDIREVNAHVTPEVDILVGGFPCQDISVAGRRAGLDGERSGLWWEYHRLLDELRPEWCVIENVAGLLSSGKPRGSDLGAILGALGELGYGFAYRVLDAQGFGVPQRRRRVFIVGRLGDGRGPCEVLLEPESGGGHLAKSRHTGAGASVGALTSPASGGWRIGADEAAAGHVFPTTIPALTTRCGNTQDDQQTFQLIPFDSTQITSALNRSHPKPGDPCHPLAAGAHAPAIVGSDVVRRLTPVECERLQGFPDNHTDGQADSHRYKQMGNAVAVPVIRWIASRMANVMSREQEAVA